MSKLICKTGVFVALKGRFDDAKTMLLRRGNALLVQIMSKRCESVNHVFLSSDNIDAFWEST